MSDEPKNAAEIDPRLHGPEFCLRVCSVCECDDGKSRHHWIDDGCDPTEEGLWEHQQAVVDYDREHDTHHAEAFYACKHCDAWAEAEYIFELEEMADRDESWLCDCGHFEESAFHCSKCGREPPWGCPGECCQGADTDEFGDGDYDPYED